MTVTAEVMQDFVLRYDVLAHLTEELLKRQDAQPFVRRYIGWHPGYFYEKLMKDLPKELTVPLEKDDFFDTSFIKELGKLDGALSVLESKNPALIQTERGEHLSILTVDFCKAMFHKIEGNANAVRELAGILEENGQKVWFTVPDKATPTVDSKQQALLETLFDLAQEKPKRFKTQVKRKLYTLGFDETTLSNGEIDLLLASIVFDD
jgi:hypothetical protein